MAFGEKTLVQVIRFGNPDIDDVFWLPEGWWYNLCYICIQKANQGPCIYKIGGDYKS